MIARQLDLAPVELDLREVQRILGEKLSTLEISRILTRLGFTMLPGSEDTTWCKSRAGASTSSARSTSLKNWRACTATTSSRTRFPPTAARSRSARCAQRRADALIAPGARLQRSDFADVHFEGRCRLFSTAAELDLANPLSDEASVMRTSMVPSMLNMLAYNLNRGTDNVRLFEAGNVFEASGEKDAAGAEAHLHRRDGQRGCGGGARTVSGGGGASASPSST